MIIYDILKRRKLNSTTEITLFSTHLKQCVCGPPADFVDENGSICST